MEESLITNSSEVKPKKFFTIFTIVNITLFILVILTSFYYFYLKKDFDFIVEVQCNPDEEQCILRDCSNPDDCPPNQLENFKRYNLNASDFSKCTNEDCKLACEGGLIECQKIDCVEDEEIGESCSITTE